MTPPGFGGLHSGEHSEQQRAARQGRKVDKVLGELGIKRRSSTPAPELPEHFIRKIPAAASSVSTSRRSLLLTPGNFSSLSTLVHLNQHADLSCALCSRFADARGWVHTTRGRVVCHVCMQDPYADDGEAGRKIEQRLERLDELERESLPFEDDLVIW